MAGKDNTYKFAVPCRTIIEQNDKKQIKKVKRCSLFFFCKVMDTRGRIKVVQLNISENSLLSIHAAHHRQRVFYVFWKKKATVYVHIQRLGNFRQGDVRVFTLKDRQRNRFVNPQSRALPVKQRNTAWYKHLHWNQISTTGKVRGAHCATSPVEAGGASETLTVEVDSLITYTQSPCTHTHTHGPCVSTQQYNKAIPGVVKMDNWSKPHTHTFSLTHEIRDKLPHGGRSHATRTEKLSTVEVTRMYTHAHAHRQETDRFTHTDLISHREKKAITQTLIVNYK